MFGGMSCAAHFVKQVDPTTLPVAFAQVREDPRLDIALARQVEARTAFLIASGGCTLAALTALTGIQRFAALDANPAQVALARLKVAALDLARSDRRALFGYAPPHHSQWRGTTARYLIPAEQVASIGPTRVTDSMGFDFVGRYEWLFFMLEQLLPPSTRSNDDLAVAFAKVFHPSRLERLFGAAATQNTRQPFADHFLYQTSQYLNALKPEVGFLNRFLTPSRHPVPTPLWFTAPRPNRIAPIDWIVGPAARHLALAPNEYDLVHLSNILDWLDTAEAAALLGHASRAVRPGGAVIVRQLNSRLDIPALCDGLNWERLEGRSLMARDSSFFYSAVHIGHKR
jgi:S-adenosylmethionine-diacylglycerol 3-amino-3-carboxypropyl transferase